MANNFKKIFIASASIFAVSACSMEEIDTGTTVDQSQSISDRTSSVAYQKGKEHLAAGHLGLALEKFKGALTQDPSSTAVLNALAVTYERLGRQDLAELYYDRTLAIDPTFSVALNNVGYSMVNRGRNEEALIYFEQALKHEQLESSRQLILANRQKAMDNLRVARQIKPAVVAEKGFVPGSTAGVRPDNECALSSGRAIDRSGARVFTLNTSDTTNTVIGDRPTINCDALVRSRVAIVSTESAGGSAAISVVRHPASIAPETLDISVPTAPKAVAKKMAVSKELANRPLDEKSASPVSLGRKASETPSATKVVSSNVGISLDLRVEISNGAGRNKLASRMRTYFEGKGLPISFLTNAARFDHSRTTIFYKKGDLAAAEIFAAQLPVPVEFVETGVYYADIRIRLGSDIITFDKSRLYAAAYGEFNA